MSLVPFILLFALILVREYTFRQERSEWLLERRELLNRVQRPEWLPVPQEAFSTPEVEPDEFNLVGVISEAVDE
ncbi:MAG: hypothetical protein EBT03_09195 [Betaproteobacteria bacterium]|nr:hypothetical protein [Betaproteobacteria bacterium]